MHGGQPFEGLLTFSPQRNNWEEDIPVTSLSCIVEKSRISSLERTGTPSVPK
jgi:hypothetical protein